MPVVHGIDLSFDNGGTWKMLYDTGAHPIYALAWGPMRKLTKRVLYWSDAASYGGAINARVRCSRDGGATVYSDLLLTGGKTVYAIGCSKLTPNIAYYGDSDGKIFKTTDYGLNWTDVTPPATTAYAFTIAVSNDGLSAVIACTSNSGFLYTNNGGTSWSSFAPASQRNAIGCCITSTGIMLGCGAYVAGGWGPTIWNVGAGSIVFDGTHGAGGYNPLSLASIDTALAGGTRVFSAHYPNYAGGLVLSKTRGSSFTDISNAIFAEPGFTDDYTTVALSKSGKVMYLSVESSGLYRSEDEGATLEKVFTFNSTLDYRVRGVVIADPVEEDWVWMLSGLDNGVGGSDEDKSIKFSEDKGETWDDMRTLITPAAYSAFRTNFALGYDKNTPGGQLGGV